ncbi:MAG: phosphatase PAP2 family protein [Gemmatimonadetes bacterium]|nr:phosphatase PAP2 family protein [Gemmatimonadota bacterium]
MDIFFRPEPVAWLQNVLGPGWEDLARTVGVLGSSWAIPLTVGLALWTGGRRVAYGLLVLAVVEAVARQALATTLAVERPSGSSVRVYDEISHSSSFPSGHVSTAAALFAYLALVTPFSLAAAALLVVALSLSRLYLGVHYVDDVIGAAVLGGGLAWAWLWAWPRLRRALRGHERTVGGAAAALTLVAAAAAAAFLVGDEPMQWNGAAVAAALAVAVPVEWLWVRFEPRAGDGGRRVALGLAGLLPLLVAERVLGGEEALALGAALMGAGTLWAVVGAPWLFTRLGWSGTDRAPAPPLPGRAEQDGEGTEV